MIRRFRFACALLLAFAAMLVPAMRAAADVQDIAAASRSVVRVALVASNGERAYFVGHGSGVAVAPNLVLTNAHVVELTRQEADIAIGIIPAEGTESYGGEVIAFSPGNDLALIRIRTGRLAPATFFAGAVQDAQQVVAIGYPGAVDRAQGMDLADIVQPMSPVKTPGVVSGGRSSKQFDTILHTAAMAAGNSGGPLVDNCGRVLGINSFGSLSDGNDAEYGFAVSNREIASFLRQANVDPQRTVAPCRSLAEMEAANRIATERAQIEAEKRAAVDAERARERRQTARDAAEQSVIADRENAMAIAAVLLALAVLAGGMAGLYATQGRSDRTRWLGIGAGVLFLGALLAFFLRPGFDAVEDRAAEMERTAQDRDRGATNVAIGDGSARDGAYLCRIDLDRSRVTVSDTADVPFSWTSAGCINGRTQFAETGGSWSRAFVPAEEASISIRSFEPASRTYRSDKYLVDAATADAARKLRGTLTVDSCTADPGEREALARLEGEVRALLPAAPNERLVYHCTPTGE